MPLQIPQLQPVVIGACRSTDIWIPIDFAGVETGDPESEAISAIQRWTFGIRCWTFIVKCISSQIRSRLGTPASPRGSKKVPRSTQAPGLSPGQRCSVTSRLKRNPASCTAPCCAAISTVSLSVRARTFRTMLPFIVDTNYPTTMGELVTVGHTAIVHACKVDNEVLVGMGSIILDDVEVGARSIIGANALVTIGTKSRRVRSCSDRPQKSAAHSPSMNKRTSRDGLGATSRTAKAVPRVILRSVAGGSWKMEPDMTCIHKIGRQQSKMKTIILPHSLRF